MRTIEYYIDDTLDGKTVYQFLKRKNYSSSLITELKKNDDNISVNGRPVFVIEKLNTGDILTVSLPQEELSPNIIAQECGYEVVFDDEDYIIYNKPSGVVVHPTKIYQSKTIGNDFTYRCIRDDSAAPFRPIYRIDRNTSGLIVAAKNKLSASTVIDKSYICICRGEIPDSGTIDSPIALSEGSKIKRCVSENGQKAVTEFERIGCGGGYSVARVKIHTGRTHQIRVHFSSIGYPLAGDTLYSDGDPGLDRHALHCADICFEHIVSGGIVKISTPIPDDMAAFISANGIKNEKKR